MAAPSGHLSGPYQVSHTTTTVVKLVCHSLDKDINMADYDADIWEGVNNQQNAQHTLHTTTGCTQSNNTALPYSGSVISNNCDYNINGNQGCVFRDNSTTS